MPLIALRRYGCALLLAAALLPGCGGKKSTAPIVNGNAYQPRTRTYYIAVDEGEWNYAPLGHNGVTGQDFDDVANVFVAQGPDRIGSTYRKARYFAYTDSNFTIPAIRAPKWDHTGFLGPVIRGVVGDTLKIYFRNNGTHPYSIHPHGVQYLKDSEGAPYDDGTSGADTLDNAVPPGVQRVFTWFVPARSGPGPMDGSSIGWMYHSHVDEVRDTNTGLIGPIIVTSAAHALADGSPDDVDQECISLFSVMNENQSLFLDYNIATYCGAPGTVNPDDEGFQESNLMHSINGYVFANGPKPVLHSGARVRWYVMGMGTEVDLHTPHWHGQTVVVNGMRTDVVSLLPMTMVTADMRPDSPGTWLFHCHVNDHILAGMLALFDVNQVLP